MTLTIDSPERKPLASAGLLEVANVITDSPPGAFHFGLQYQPEVCGHNKVIPAEGVEKTPDAATEANASVGFGMYRMIEDAILTDADPSERVRNLYKLSESWGVERAVQTALLNPTAVNLTPTPGTPVTNMKHALGLLEQYAADNYAGLPIIHGNRLAVSLIPDLVREGDGIPLHTIHGTPIANGGGYGPVGPGNVSATSGRAWLYISGQVNIWVEPLRVYGADGDMAYDLRGNRVYSLAEGRYLTTVECFVAAILVGAV